MEPDLEFADLAILTEPTTLTEPATLAQERFETSIPDVNPFISAACYYCNEDPQESETECLFLLPAGSHCSLAALGASIRTPTTSHFVG